MHWALSKVPSVVVAVMKVCPVVSPVTTPSELTVATALSELSHTTAVHEASAGLTEAVSCTVLPTSTDASAWSIAMPVAFISSTVIVKLKSSHSISLPAGVDSLAL